MDSSTGNAARPKTYTLKSIPRTAPTSFKIDYAGELNPQQLSAVQKIDGPQLVIAGAGSGKTRTLVYRVAYLVEHGIDPNSILLLTFTRKASQEMLRRATHILDDRCRMIKGGTFHSFANNVLRKHAPLLGYDRNFSILDRGDAEDMLNLIRTESGLTKTDSRFPKKQTILEIFSKSINTGRTLADILYDDFPQFSSEEMLLTRLFGDYQQFKFERSVMDYDDLLLLFRKLLTEHDAVRKALSLECRYIMIDEYQDTNRIQSDIAQLLASEHQNILAVGDDAQSIYSFRGAEFRNIMDFPNRFPGCVVTTIEQNYRSTLPILAFANALLDSAIEKYPKKLFSTIEAEQRPVLLRPQSVEEQAQFISQRILELREEGVALDQIAVLFRASWHSNELEVELQGHNIPFVKFGGLKFVEAAHVKDVVAFLRITRNPRDAVAWHRVLLLLEGIGPKTARDVITNIIEEKQGLDGLVVPEKKKYSGTLDQLRALLKELEKQEDPDRALELIGEFYFPLMKSKYDDYNKRLDDLQSLVQMSSRYKNMSSFLDDLSLELPDQSQTDTDPTSRDDEELILSTIHSAKGLEWHTVFLISLIDGYLPSSRALHSRTETEEERRLLYVACTRAQRNLYLLCPEHSRTRGFSPMSPGFAFSDPSRFLSEIRDFSDLTEHWQLSEEYQQW